MIRAGLMLFLFACSDDKAPSNERRDCKLLAGIGIVYSHYRCDYPEAICFTYDQTISCIPRK